MFDPALWGNLPDYAVFTLPLAVMATLVALLVFARRGKTQSGAPKPRAMTAVSSLAPRQDVLAPAPGRAELEKRLSAASAAGESTLLAPIYLDLARWHGQKGNDAARMEALRSAAGCGALHGPRSAYAAARLELAEAAYVAGDLTGACEQWQLARTAFLEDGQSDQHERVEKRMRDNGCPTDWVLTDF